MQAKKIVLILFIILFCVSVVGNGFLGFVLVKNQKTFQAQQTNQKIYDFRNLFEEKVLLSSKDIDFNTRLALETSVRALNDKQIFDQWESFANSQTKESATSQAKALLELLIQKTSAN